MKQIIVLLVLLSLSLSGCKDSRSVTLTDPKTGQTRTFTCGDGFPVVQGDDLRFILPYYTEVVIETANTKDDIEVNNMLIEAWEHGDLNRVAAIVLWYKCRQQ